MKEKNVYVISSLLARMIKPLRRVQTIGKAWGRSMADSPNIGSNNKHHLSAISSGNFAY